jgi:hypothetical protein
MFILPTLTFRTRRKKKPDLTLVDLSEEARVPEVRKSSNRNSYSTKKSRPLTSGAAVYLSRYSQIDINVIISHPTKNCGTCYSTKVFLPYLSIYGYPTVETGGNLIVPGNFFDVIFPQIFVVKIPQWIVECGKS